MTETIIWDSYFRGRCKIKMKCFGQTPSSTTSKYIFFVAEKLFTCFIFILHLTIQAILWIMSILLCLCFICFMLVQHVGVKISCSHRKGTVKGPFWEALVVPCLWWDLKVGCILSYKLIFVSTNLFNCSDSKFNLGWIN